MKNIENFTLNFMNIHELRDLARFVGVETPTMYDKDELIKQIKIQRAKNEKVEDSKPRRGRPPKNKYEETFNSKDGNWILEELKKKALKKIERMQKSKNNKKLKEIEERENFNLEEYFAQQKIDEEQKIHDEQNYKAENTILNENDNINHNETNLNVDIKEQEDSTIVIENDNQKKNKDNDNTQTDEDDEELEDAKFIKETRYKTFTDDQLLTQNIYHDDALLDEMLLKPEVTLNTSSTEFDEMPNDTYQAAGYFKSFGLNRYFVFCDDKYDLEEAILVPKNIVAKYNFRTGDYIEFYYKLYLGVGLKSLYKVINKSDFVNQLFYYQEV